MLRVPFRSFQSDLWKSVLIGSEDVLCSTATSPQNAPCWTVGVDGSNSHRTQEIMFLQSCWITCDLPLSAEDKQVEGEAAYQLGLTYQRAGDTETAKQVPDCGGCVELFPSTLFMYFQIWPADYTVCPVLQHLHADLHVTPGCRRTRKVLLCHDKVFGEVHTQTHTKQKLWCREHFVFVAFSSLSTHRFLHVVPFLSLPLFLYICACVSARET